jgi:hypothetical protein
MASSIWNLIILIKIHGLIGWSKRSELREQPLYTLIRLGGRRNTYGIVVWSEHLRGLWAKHLQQIMYSQKTYTLCVFRRPTLNYV